MYRKKSVFFWETNSIQTELIRIEAEALHLKKTWTGSPRSLYFVVTFYNKTKQNISVHPRWIYVSGFSKSFINVYEPGIHSPIMIYKNYLRPHEKITKYFYLSAINIDLHKKPNLKLHIFNYCKDESIAKIEAKPVNDSEPIICKR